MELVLEQCAAEGSLHFAFPGRGVLPAVETDDSDDLVDVIDDTFDNDRCLGVLDRLE